MKIQQIEYAIEVSKTLSFSKASKNLYVSQPNISNSIASLEAELDFSIFIRTNKGILITDKGMDFLQHAQNIIYELKQIEALKSGKKYYHFSVRSTFNHSATSEAFKKLFLKYQYSDNLDFSIKNGDLSEIVEDVYLNKCDLGIVLISENLLAHNKKLISNKELNLIILKKVAININLNHKHPLLKTEPFDFDGLNNYIYVDYDFNIHSDYPNVITKSIVNPSKIVRIAERNTRMNIISNTTAFSIGCKLPPEIQTHYKCISIPLDGVYCYIGYIAKDTLKLKAEAKTFIEILKKEIEFM